METTYKFKIKHINNPLLLDDVIFNYTGLYYKLYNNIELSKDRDFIDYCLDKFKLDKTMYDYCVVDVNMGLLSEKEDKKGKQKDIDKINDKLIELSKIKTLTKKQKKQKKQHLRKKHFLEKNINKGSCFGGKDMLRQITKLKQNNNRTKKQDKILKRIQKEYKNKRKRNIFLWGKAIEGGNRKMDFFLDENKVIFKVSKKEHIEIVVCPFDKSKKREDNIYLINEKLKTKDIPLTIRIDKEYVYMSFDTDILYGQSFNIKEYNKIIKENPLIDKNQLRIDIHRETEKKMISNLIENRVAGVDFNPHEIGFSISEIKEEEVDRILFYCSFDLSFFTKQKKLSKKDKNKLNYEIHKIYDYIFKMCKHFKVSCFGLEDLKGITDNPIKEKGRTFNRATHNMWCRNLQVIAIKNRCSAYGIRCNEVNAAYSSFIGNIKYEIYDCCASSAEISRRAYLKYKKSESFLYPCVTKEDIERMIHLYGQDLVADKTWVFYYNKFKTKNSGYIGGWWRNKNFTVGKHLNSYRSNVTICT